MAATPRGPSRIITSQINAGVDSYVAGLIETGIEAVNAAGLRMTMRAKHYAPVRRVFVGMRRGQFQGAVGVAAIPMGIRRQLGIRGGAPDRSQSVNDMTRADFDRLRSSGRAPRYRADRGIPSDVGGNKRNRRLLPSGNANTMIPVFANQPHSSRITGDFRRVTKDGRLAKVTTISDTGNFSSARSFGRTDASSRLSVRGRYELKTGRAIYPTYLPELNRERMKPRAIGGVNLSRPFGNVQNRLGGRLRAQIMWEAATLKGDLIQGWTVSPTEYARYQEFGTSRNRPHPFLRPALYEARTYLPRMLRAAFKELA